MKKFKVAELESMNLYNLFMNGDIDNHSVCIYVLDGIQEIELTTVSVNHDNETEERGEVYYYEPIFSIDIHNDLFNDVKKLTGEECKDLFKNPNKYGYTEEHIRFKFKYEEKEYIVMFSRTMEYDEYDEVANITLLDMTIGVIF